jgi:class 3 adenylate cyclase/pimeloyl-ACP methyl ester carboxylesterase
MRGRTMPEERLERRLTAILAGDVAGYSRMMGEDETGTLAQLQAHHSQLIAPCVAQHQGRIVKRTGDGFLAEFGSVVEAVECAAQIQRGMAARNRDVPETRQLAYRIGVHLGDVIIDQDDIYGDGVNIAARLEGAAEAGGICVSRQAYDQVEGKLPLAFRNLGPQTLKNIAKPVEAFAIDASTLGSSFGAQTSIQANLTQEVRYARTLDGVRLAWAKVGHGPPLVRAGHWLSHLEYDWESPLWRPGLINLAQNHTLIRYDPRGTGLSDWDVDELSLDAWVSDLEAVVDAAGVERFPLLGYSQSCAVSIAYAVRHPERVSHLVLYGGFARGGNKRAPQDKEKSTAMATLMRIGWGANDAAFRQMFTSQMMPGATKEQADSFNELQRRTTSPECAVRYFETVGDFDIADLLARVGVPTLVMHARGDLRQPFEAGRELAAGIPRARFVALQSQNHILLPGEPAAVRFGEELELFLTQ